MKAKGEMRIIKRYLMLLVFIGLLTGILCSCELSAASQVTYDDLSDEEKAIVDFVYSKSSQWESECTEVAFTKVNESPAFYVTYYKVQRANEYSGWAKWYLYDIVDNAFEEVHSQYKYMTIVSSDSTSYYRGVWNSNWSEGEKKNHLAQKLNEYLHR